MLNNAIKDGNLNRYMCLGSGVKVMSNLDLNYLWATKQRAAFEYKQQAGQWAFSPLRGTR